MNQRDFWDKATESDNLRNEWICDKEVTDQQCLDLILPHLKDGKTLDLGCGIGRLTQGYGVDISPKMIELAKPGNEYRVCDGSSIPYPKATFDNVFSVFLFQHLPNRQKLDYLKEIERVLKPGGILRLQYVNDGDRGPMSHPISDYLMSDMLTRTGFKTTSKSNDIYGEWTWLTATK